MMSSFKRPPPFQDTVKIRDSALGLSGFVCFFWWAYLRGAYPRRIYSYVLWAYLTKITFLGGLSAEGPICGGGAITDFYGISWSVKNGEKNMQLL